MADAVPAEQDWGESSGAHLAVVREANSHKRFERTFQLMVLGLLSTLTVLLVIVDVVWVKTMTKDVLLVLLPAFTFVLGKLDARES